MGGESAPGIFFWALPSPTTLFYPLHALPHPVSTPNNPQNEWPLELGLGCWLTQTAWDLELGMGGWVSVEVNPQKLK